MKLPSKIRYATRILAAVQLNNALPLPLSIIEKKEGISAKYAKQIMQPLEHRGIIKGKRGVKGGYLLVKKPADIYLMDIFDAFGTEVSLTPCSTNSECALSECCCAEKTWNRLNSLITSFLSTTSLQDMLDEKEKEEK